MRGLDWLQPIMRSRWTDSACREEASVRVQMAVGMGKREDPALPLHPAPPPTPRSIATDEEDPTRGLRAHFSPDRVCRGPAVLGRPRERVPLRRGGQGRSVPVCHARQTPDVWVAFPSPSPAARRLGFRRDGSALGGMEQPAAAGAERAQTIAPSLRTKGGGWRGRQPIWCSRSRSLAALQGVVQLISAWHLHVFSHLSLLQQKCENLKEKEL